MSKKIFVSDESKIECCKSQIDDFPNARSKHAVCHHSRHIYIHSGIDRNLPHRDFWRYNVDLSTWEKIKESGDIPPNLQSHTLTPYKDFLYVFGGNFWFDGSNETPLWIYEISSGSWRKSDTNNEAPHPCSRRCHSATLYEKCLYIYGGYIDLKGSTEEFWFFDMERESWHALSSGLGPGPRHSHTTVVHKDAMWLTGGMTGLKVRTDMWCWNFGTLSWVRVKQSGPELVGHSAVSLGTHMAAYGGIRDGLFHADLWLFSYETLMWQKISHTSLPAVSHHSLLLLPPEGDSDTSGNKTPDVSPQKLKSENRIFRNRVLPSDNPQGGDLPEKTQTQETESTVCRTKLAWSENTPTAYCNSNLSLNLKHYADTHLLHNGVKSCNAHLPERQSSVNSWDSALSESDPLLKKTTGNRLKENGGFINTAYVNSSHSNSSLEIVLKDWPSQPGNLSGHQCVNSQCLHHGVHGGNFGASRCETSDLFSSKSTNELREIAQFDTLKARNEFLALGIEKPKPLSIDCEDLIIENIENISDTDSATTELLPRSQYIDLTTVKNSKDFCEKNQDQINHQSITADNQHLASLCILGGRQVRGKDFAQVKSMSMWTFKINL